MAIDLTFGNTVVSVPTDSDAPDWAQGVTAAFQAIANTLQSVANQYDVPSQSISIDASNPGVANTNIPALFFPTSTVRAINISYAVFRTTNTNTAYETGNIIAEYSPSNPVNSMWEMSQDNLGNGLISFNITDLGQVQYTCTTLAGTGHTGRIIFSAQALLQS
jgi:hypothetical protein